jgi:hypothetical protein
MIWNIGACRFEEHIIHQELICAAALWFNERRLVHVLTTCINAVDGYSAGIAMCQDRANT